MEAEDMNQSLEKIIVAESRHLYPEYDVRMLEMARLCEGTAIFCLVQVQKK